MQTITTKYFPPTHRRGSRFIATNAAGVSVRIKESPEWTNRDTGHVEAVRALKQKIGNRWPDLPMIGGSLNERGDMVWVFVSDNSPRITLEPTS